MTDEPQDTLSKLLYMDPLVYSGIMNLDDAQHREKAVSGDLLLTPYIPELDEEIFSDPPVLEPSGQEIWIEDNLSAMAIQIADLGRTHGWSIVQFYKKAPIWRVFSQLDKTKWILSADKSVIVGVAVHYGTETSEDCIFGKNQCYLFKFKEGNNKDIFAYSDIKQSQWTVATITRQIQSQLDMMASKPEFLHIVYGTPTPAQRKLVLGALDEVSTTQGIAMTKTAVEEIRVIRHESYQDLLNVIDKKTQQFAGLTRLPLAFYNGERTSGSGTGGAAEQVVENKIDRKKKHIFNLIKPIILKLYADRYKITLTTIEMDMNEIDPVIDKSTNVDDGDTKNINTNVEEDTEEEDE